jgi:hypothetical protein
MQQPGTEFESLAKNLWPDQHGPWPEPTVGIILDCGAISLPQTP